ncbi:Methyltransferase domain [Geosmithia morbida]|uniref:Methyltransferase domain n=1 Tax=Geosmithia morbida TaxID=1094350 RepID=A0A9P4Z214_9HYPO|nr:Methyltransferase domain [Geosmithia morbida]KAF4125204.1 Methyltransferase domain [Geosmithia morbida]
MAGQQDHWDSGEYQNSASFVAKLAGKVVEWLDLQKDDSVLDIGCGDGILDLEFSKVVAQGKGSVYGFDSSAAMIEAARKLCSGTNNTTFAVLDGGEISSDPSLQKGTFTKAFSNAAMHWILAAPAARETFFRDVHASLVPGGIFAFEMGGLGNVAEMRTAILMAAARRIGLDKAKAAEPWFFPDEEWVSTAMKEAGFRVDRVEREWRPTKADKGGVEGWVRLFGKIVLEQLDEKDREDVVREAADVLRVVCKMPGDGEMISYVRLRAVGTKI